MKKKCNNLFGRFVTRLLTLLGFGTSALAFVACYAPPMERFHAEINPQNITLPSEGCEATHVSVQSNGDWRVDYDSSYITVTPQIGWGDTTLTISVKENLDSVDRSTVIKLGDGDVDYEIFVNQRGSR